MLSHCSFLVLLALFSHGSVLVHKQEKGPRFSFLPLCFKIPQFGSYPNDHKLFEVTCWSNIFFLSQNHAVSSVKSVENPDLEPPSETEASCWCLCLLAKVVVPLEICPNYWCISFFQFNCLIFFSCFVPNGWTSTLWTQISFGNVVVQCIVKWLISCRVEYTIRCSWVP